ncbi:MAG: hypothetical protein ACI8PP_001817 [Candidatus Pseudothioglobus sp.]|jgi:hypothetical protein
MGGVLQVVIFLLLARNWLTRSAFFVGLNVVALTAECGLDEVCLKDSLMLYVTQL